MAYEHDGSNYEQPTPRLNLDFPKETEEGLDEQALAQWMANQMLACPTEPDEMGRVWNSETWTHAVWLNTMDWVYQLGYGSKFFTTVHIAAANIYDRETRRASARWWQFWQ